MSKEDPEQPNMTRVMVSGYERWLDLDNLPPEVYYVDIAGKRYYIEGWVRVPVITDVKHVGGCLLHVEFEDLRVVAFDTSICAHEDCLNIDDLGIIMLANELFVKNFDWSPWSISFELKGPHAPWNEKLGSNSKKTTCWDETMYWNEEEQEYQQIKPMEDKWNEEDDYEEDAAKRVDNVNRVRITECEIWDYGTIVEPPRFIYATFRRPSTPDDKRDYTPKRKSQKIDRTRKRRR